MKESFGQRFQRLRKVKKFTQEDVANKLNISPQAVSKWENDLAYPDITYLSEISEFLDVSLDELLGKVNKEQTILATEEIKNRKNIVLKIVVDTKDGDKVRVNLPLALFKMLAESGEAAPKINNVSLKGIDLKEVYRLAEIGVIGKIIEVETADGDQVYIFVE